MTKVFQKTFDCVKDSGGEFHVFHNHAMHIVSNSNGGLHCHDIGHGIELLKSSGHITETPLDKANDDLNKIIGHVNQWWYVRDIMKKLYEETACQSKN